MQHVFRRISGDEKITEGNLVLAALAGLLAEQTTA